MTTKGEGVKNTQIIYHVVYEWPLCYIIKRHSDFFFSIWKAFSDGSYYIRISHFSFQIYGPWKLQWWSQSKGDCFNFYVRGWGVSALKKFPHILEIFTSRGFIWAQEVNISNIHISKCGYWHYKQFYYIQLKIEKKNFFLKLFIFLLHKSNINNL